MSVFKSKPLFLEKQITRLDSYGEWLIKSKIQLWMLFLHSQHTGVYQPQPCWIPTLPAGTKRIYFAGLMVIQSGTH